MIVTGIVLPFSFKFPKFNFFVRFIGECSIGARSRWSDGHLRRKQRFSLNSLNHPSMWLYRNQEVRPFFITMCHLETTELLFRINSDSDFTKHSSSPRGKPWNLESIRRKMLISNNKFNIYNHWVWHYL